MTIDITEKNTFITVALICLIFGSVLGMFCALLFEIVSHPRIEAVNGYLNGTEISPFWGSVFILIMAFTALGIAVTFRFVPGWVAAYYQTREIPTVFLKIWDWIKSIDKMLQETEEE